MTGNLAGLAERYGSAGLDRDESVSRARLALAWAKTGERVDLQNAIRLERIGVGIEHGSDVQRVRARSLVHQTPHRQAA